MKIKPFNTIGIGVTFSPNLKANIYEASRLAIFLKCKLLLIHVGDKTQEKVDDFKAILEPFIKEGLDFEIVFQTGDPVEVILSTTEQKNVDLLILGALKKENFLKYYMGSIARKITRQAKCSVLLLINPSVNRVTCNHIVVNGLKDPKTKETINTAVYMAKYLGSKKVTIVEEISQQEVSVQIEDDKSLRKSTIVKERIKLREESRVKNIIKDIPEEYLSNTTLKTQPIFGKRGYSIGHYAQVARADLLVMNSPSKMTFWDRLFPHDIEHILAELPTDVLIVQ